LVAGLEYQYPQCPLRNLELIRCQYPFLQLHPCGSDAHLHREEQLIRSVLTEILPLSQRCHSGTPRPLLRFLQHCLWCLRQVCYSASRRQLQTARPGHVTYLSNVIVVLPYRRDDRVIRASNYANLAFETDSFRQSHCTQTSRRFRQHHLVQLVSPSHQMQRTHRDLRCHLTTLFSHHQYHDSQQSSSNWPHLYFQRHHYPSSTAPSHLPHPRSCTAGRLRLAPQINISRF
jgi:hypothetical protein